MQKTANRKTVVTAAVVFVILVIVGLFVWQATAPKGTEGTKSFEFSVIDAQGEKEVYELSTDREMLGDALLDEGLIEGEDGDYGLFVKTVGGITADDGNQEWWCLTKGGEAVMTGVDSTPVEDGAAYEFTLTVGW